MHSDTPYFMWSAEARCFVPERSEQTTFPPFSANHSDTPPAPPPTSRQYRLRGSTRSSQKRTASNHVATSNWQMSARMFRCHCSVTRRLRRFRPQRLDSLKGELELDSLRRQGRASSQISTCPPH